MTKEAKFVLIVSKQDQVTEFLSVYEKQLKFMGATSKEITELCGSIQDSIIFEDNLPEDCCYYLTLEDYIFAKNTNHWPTEEDPDMVALPLEGENPLGWVDIQQKSGDNFNNIIDLAIPPKNILH